MMAARHNKGHNNIPDATDTVDGSEIRRENPPGMV